MRALGLTRRLPVTRPTSSAWKPQRTARCLHLVELLLGQGDERRGVVGDGAGVQRLEQGGLGDERLAGAGRAQTSTPCSAVNQASRASSCTG